MTPPRSPSEHDLPSDDPERPIYTIGTVAKMVGVPAATLRTWEDRYEGVVPSREVSGRRLYSRSQVARLRFVKDQIDQGLQPSEAHRLLDERQFGPATVSPLAVGADLVHVRFLSWSLEHRDQLRGILAGLREATTSATAFLKVNVPHPEYGLTSTGMVRATTQDRIREGRDSTFAGVAWSLLPEVCEPLRSGRTHQFRSSDLGPEGRRIYEGTDLRSELAAPIHHQAEWLAAVGVADVVDRVWGGDEIGIVERARDLLAADFAAAEARVRFGRIVQPAVSESGPLADGTTGPA